MSGHSFSDFGTMISADTTLEDAAKWAEELQKKEFRGLGDSREEARRRLSIKIGVDESYLKRLRHKKNEMRDLPASIYIRLCLAYERICVSNERKAAEFRAERQSLKEKHEAHQEHCGAGR